MKIRAIVKKPGCGCIVRKISSTKKAMQKLCGGYFDTMDFADGCVIVFRRTCENSGLPFNIRLEGRLLCGTFVICGMENGEFVDVSPLLANRLDEEE